MGRLENSWEAKTCRANSDILHPSRPRTISVAFCLGRTTSVPIWANEQTGIGPNSRTH